MRTRSESSPSLETRIAGRDSRPGDGDVGCGGSAIPGGHALDVSGLTGADGGAACTSDLLRRPGHLLLTTTGGPQVLDRLRAVLGVLAHHATAEDVPAGILVNSAEEIARYHDVGHSGMALLRADGHLGLLSTTTGPQALADHFSHLHVAAASSQRALAGR